MMIALHIGAAASAAAGDAAAEAAASGFGLATAVLIFLALALVYALGCAIWGGLGRSTPVGPAWLNRVIPVLVVIGLGIAAYLTFVETRNVQAVCGPVGDCNTVQSSPYARLFGVLPVGVLGLAGYVAMLLAWAVATFTAGRLAELAPIALLAMALFGVLFSLYLTYLELYIILAVCIWCLSSAVIMALLLLLSVGPALGSTIVTEPQEGIRD